jgi:hypothetical protein
LRSANCCAFVQAVRWSAAIPFAEFAIRRQAAAIVEQSFRLHGGLDAVEHDADAVGELFQEHRLQRGECRDRCEFDNRLDAIFEQYWEHDHVARSDLEQCRSDRHGVLRHVSD